MSPIRLLTVVRARRMTDAGDIPHDKGAPRRVSGALLRCCMAAYAD